MKNLLPLLLGGISIASVSCGSRTEEVIKTPIAPVVTQPKEEANKETTVNNTIRDRLRDPGNMATFEGAEESKQPQNFSSVNLPKATNDLEIPQPQSAIPQPPLGANGVPTSPRKKPQ